MSLGDFFKGVAESTLKDLLNKANRKLSPRRRRRKTPTTTLRAIEKLLRPATKQVSRKATLRTRAKAKRRGY